MRVGRHELDELCGIAETASREIMAVYSGAIESWTKADASPLTEADLLADAVIRRWLERAFPGVFILSEESCSSGPAQAETYFLVDPLDGTKEFLKRNGEFTVNIALIDKGDPIAGVVQAPALDELFFSARGVGAFKRSEGQTTNLRTTGRSHGEPLRVVASRSHGGEALAAWLAKIGEPYSLVEAGSSLKFCRIAEGRADVYPRPGPTSQWDTAAAQAVLAEAGGVVLDSHGDSLRYGLDRPVLNPFFIALAHPALRVPPLA